MSVKVVYQQIMPRDLGVVVPGCFVGILEKTFGSFPLELDRNAVEKLRTIAAADEQDRIAWERLIEAIGTYSKIRVDVE